MMLNWFMGFYIAPSILGGRWNWSIWQFVIFMVTAPFIIEGIYRWVELPGIALGKRACRAASVFLSSKKGEVEEAVPLSNL
jgi:hypothetical protein